MIELGSDVTLPSGKQVRITAPFDAQRPWRAIRTTDAWQVCRSQGRLGDRSGTFYFGGRPIPVELDEIDAKALADKLNQVRPGKYPG